MKENSGMEKLAGEYKRTEKIKKLSGGKRDVYMNQTLEESKASLREQARALAEEKGLDPREELAKFGLSPAKVKSVKAELEKVHRKMIETTLSKALDHAEADPLLIESFIEEAKEIYGEAGMGDEYAELLKPFEDAKLKLVQKKEAVLTASEQPGEKEIPLPSQAPHVAKEKEGAKKYTASSRLGRWYNKTFFQIDHATTEQRAHARKAEKAGSAAFKQELMATGIDLKKEKGFLKKMFNRNENAQRFVPTAQTVTQFVERYKEIAPLMPEAGSPLAYDMQVTTSKIIESAISAYRKLPEPKDPKMLGPLEKFLPKEIAFPNDVEEAADLEKAA